MKIHNKFHRFHDMHSNYPSTLHLRIFHCSYRSLSLSLGLFHSVPKSVHFFPCIFSSSFTRLYHAQFFYLHSGSLKMFFFVLSFPPNVPIIQSITCRCCCCHCLSSRFYESKLFIPFYFSTFITILLH